MTLPGGFSKLGHLMAGVRKWQLPGKLSNIWSWACVEAALSPTAPANRWRHRLHVVKPNRSGRSLLTALLCMTVPFGRSGCRRDDGLHAANGMLAAVAACSQNVVGVAVHAKVASRGARLVARIRSIGVVGYSGDLI
jgi:hypothetical protein